MLRWREAGLFVLGLLLAAWSVGDWVQVRALKKNGLEAEAWVTVKRQEDKIGIRQLGYDYLISYT
ncbi:hypothetical protein [Roseibium sp. M-1]